MHVVLTKHPINQFKPLTVLTYILYLQGILNSLEEDKRNLLEFTMDNHDALDIVEEEEEDLSSERGIQKVHT